MINVNPQGNVYLCKTPLESDMKNQLTFSSRNAQQTYFMSTVVRTMDNSTYIRKDGGIKVNIPIEDIRQCNYLFYTNTGFSNRTYYCYITGLTYLSENSTLISIETDCWQTWGFDLEYKQCFIEREHVNDDTVGKHTIPEQLETGEYICDGTTAGLSALNRIPCAVMQVTTMLLSGGTSSSMDIPSGFTYIAFRDYNDLKRVVKFYENEGRADAINAIYLSYEELFDPNGWSSDPGVSITLSSEINRTPLNKKTFPNIEIGFPTKVGTNYTPRNNKLKTWPYCYLQATNYNGTIVNYHWEDFNLDQARNKVSFKFEGVLSVGGSFFCYPEFYKNIQDNYDEGIALGKLPVGGWTTDVYTNWLTSNSVNIAMGIIGGVANTASGIMGMGMTMSTGGLLGGASVGTAIGGIEQIGNTIGEVYQHSMAPDQARGNTNIGDVNFSFDRIKITLKRMTIKDEYARIIDNYFTMYGYKVNVVKQLAVTGRRYWNYVKTIDCNIDGDIPQDDLNTIRSMFDQGCTFWHDPAHMYDYSLNNTIV